MQSQRGVKASEAYLRGRRAELVVSQALEAWGYQILGRNLRVGRAEIDVLARSDDVVAVVEVRCRSASSWQGPLQSISVQKQRRLKTAAALLWQQQFVHDSSVNRIRFDVAGVWFGPEGKEKIEYVKGAFL